ncbi:MAG: sigma-54-dependent Fis family transcriptional regulator [Candidatus Sumerlaeia bacterium]|nr:sigma-54-dependent Fis family transcriptional regulator [Candidatus Sumerlaeia bacterium]
MSNRQRILIVDDERDVVTGFRRVFERDNIDVEAAHSGQEALAAIRRNRPDLVLMDLRMPGMDGLEALQKIHASDPRLIVIMMTAFGTSASVIKAMKHGAYDYLIKPFSIEKLREVVFEALKVSADMNTLVTYEPRLGEEEHGDMIIGKSEAMRQVFKTIGQVANSKATVLITGESGTGKELIARAIYTHSDRAGAPFIAINCAAIPEALLESELFGHERGAFTSAVNRRAGKFELANAGTLFLDEIGDMSLPTQTKILRVLQSGEFERIGGGDLINVDVRIIAATNQPLEAMIEDGTFRNDLYYRLNVVRVELPPLRERREDIPYLIEYFLRKEVKNHRARDINISSSAMEKLQEWDWPGNVRELENTIRNAVLTTKSDTILPADIRLQGEGHERPAGGAAARGPIATQPSSGKMPRIDTTPRVVEDFTFSDVEEMIAPIFELLVSARERGNKFSTFDVAERALLVHALNQTRGNQLRASRLLGITRSTLRKRIARYGIQLDTKVRTINPDDES